MPQKCLCLNPGWGALERDFTILFLPGGIPSLLTAAVSFLAQPWPTLSTLNLNAQLPRAPEQEPSLPNSKPFFFLLTKGKYKQDLPHRVLED